MQNWSGEENEATRTTAKFKKTKISFTSVN